MARNGKTQPWVWVAAGCGVAVLIGFVVVAGLGFAGWRWAKGMEAQLEDPVAREAKVLEVLGAEQLPEGWHPVMAMEVPFAMKMAMLSDRPVDFDEGDPDLDPEDLGESGLIYFEMPSWGRQRGDLDDFMAGRTDDTEVLSRSSIDLPSGEVVGRGEVALPGAERARYVVQHGSYFQGEGEGLTATVLAECAGDSRLRVAIWFEPDPASEDAAVELDLTGTVGDPARLADFLGAFRFCG